MIREAIATLVSGDDLAPEEMTGALTEIMEGQSNPSQVAAFLVALRMKGEVPEEVAAAAEVMRSHAVTIPVALPELMDTCGTGGDGLSTFNISTVSAFVLAAAGVPVAKHGNRRVSSTSGSADILEELGVELSLTPEQVGNSILETGMGFMFAPNFHPAMRHAAGVRKDIGIRTMFNMLGPLTNPAGARYQLLGVYDRGVLQTVARALGRLGSERALVVHGEDGMDEITLTGKTYAAFLADSCVEEMVIDPGDFGYSPCRPEELAGGSVAENAKIARDILSGDDKGPRRQIICANAGAALFVSGKAASLAEGAQLAEKGIDSGEAMKRLEALVTFSRNCSG